MISKRCLLLVAASFCVTCLAFGVSQRRRSRSKYGQSVERLGHQDCGPAKLADFSGVISLPSCVQNYFNFALRPGQLQVQSARINQSGRIQLGKTASSWKSFSARQAVSTSPVGFIWDAKVLFFPGFKARITDSYLGGQGYSEAELFSLVKIGQPPHDSQVSSAALMRYLAEAVWYPTALLPSSGVRWLEHGENTALARFKDGSNEVELLFRFASDGPVLSVYSPARGRWIGGRVVPTPWEAVLGNFECKQGMMVPTQAWVGWYLDEKFFPVWEGQLDSIEYQFGRF